MQNLETRLFSQEIKEREKFITQRMVVKIGSESITGGKEILDPDFMDNIAKQVSYLYKSGVKVAIVTSGAVACGKSRVKDYDGSPDKKREAAAKGQVKLIIAWHKAFKKYELDISQFLPSEENLLYGKNVIKLSMNDSIPIINENDPFTSFGVNGLNMEQPDQSVDNDYRAGSIVEAVNADTLVLLTHEDGVKDINDKVREIIYADEDISETIVFYGKSIDGTGGMESKHNVSVDVARQGEKAVIANGREIDVLLRIARGENVGTTYLASQSEALRS